MLPVPNEDLKEIRKRDLRVRKVLQDVKKLAQEVRVHVQDTKKA